MDCLQEFWVLLLPVEKGARRDADLYGCCLGRESVSHGIYDLVTKFRTVGEGESERGYLRCGRHAEYWRACAQVKSLLTAPVI